MSLPQQPLDHENGSLDAIDNVSNARQSRTMPLSGALDPEALTSIELTAAPGPGTQQKLDDPHLVCFDENYDAEK
jgi:hypothetical protein